MKTLRRATERGAADHGWLDTKHTFSFADYYDEAHMGFRALRVINEDRVKANKGFGTHGHRDMEIVSYVLKGALAHEDSMGNGSTIRPGDVQRMSAGTGVRHSERNASSTDDVHFLQIWLMPDEDGIAPSYEQTHVPVDAKRGTLKLVASPTGGEGVVKLHTDASIYASVLSGDERVTHTFAAGRYGWLHVATGSVSVDGQRLSAGDGLALSDEASITIAADGTGEALLFDLA